MNVTVYHMLRMTGRDKPEQIRRAKYVTAILAQYGIRVISPVLEENVENVPGPLVNDNEQRLEKYWRRDKEIIRYEAHVELWDGANEFSIGCIREYGLSRYHLWKPTVLLMPNTGLTVSKWEDDYVSHDLHTLGHLIRERWGTPEKRIMWRLKMLIRCLPKRIYDEFFLWR